jgi:hypothetical protein
MAMKKPCGFFCVVIKCQSQNAICVFDQAVAAPKRLGQQKAGKSLLLCLNSSRSCPENER